jgi:hypothetical protein
LKQHPMNNTHGGFSGATPHGGAGGTFEAAQSAWRSAAKSALAAIA